MWGVTRQPYSYLWLVSRLALSRYATVVTFLQGERPQEIDPCFSVHRGPDEEGVSKLLIGDPVWVSERHRTTPVIASHDDYASAALPLLPRDRYWQAWYVA